MYMYIYYAILNFIYACMTIIYIVYIINNTTRARYSQHYTLYIFIDLDIIKTLHVDCYNTTR